MADNSSNLCCNECNNWLPNGNFSKSQINKLHHKKIDFIRCIKCTEDLVHNKELKEKKPKAKNIPPEINKKPEKDPSLKYIKDPTKAPMVLEALKFFHGFSISFEVFLGSIEHWRTVAKIAVRSVSLKNNTKVTKMGLFLPGSHDVSDCKNSPSHHQQINKVIEAVDSIRSSIGVEGYKEGVGMDISICERHNSYLKYLILSIERRTQKVQLTLVWNALPSHEAAEKILTKLKSGLANSYSHLLHSIWVNYNFSNQYDNKITCYDMRSWKLLFGEKNVLEVVYTDMLNPPKLRFPPQVFRQANIDAFSNIIGHIRRWIKSFAQIIKDEREPLKIEKNVEISCVELYGGVGTIGLNCLDLLSSLQCSDENPNNKICFEETLNEMEPNFIKKAIYKPFAAAKIATAGGLENCDLVIVDPPRKGLDAEVIEALMKDDTVFEKKKRKRGIKPKRLIYISCGFKAFQRDARDLMGINNEESDHLVRWRLVHAEGHVLFPGANHIEVLAVFDRYR